MNLPAPMALWAALQTSPPIGNSPGWVAAIPAVIFLVLAAITWWVWRYLARDDE